MSLDSLKCKSTYTFTFWKDHARDWAPDETAKKAETARLDWLIDLTNSLSIWEDIGLNMTQGDIVLAYANLGALIEGWLKLFYCVHLSDYKASPMVIPTKPKPRKVRFEDLTLAQLIDHGDNVLWDTKSDWGKWAHKIRRWRNCIHAFDANSIGSPQEYLDDVGRFGDFVNLIDNQIPYPEA